MPKGVVLAGGAGTRLYPMTSAVVKQLLPIYDKPLIYYPISALMLAGISDILIITTPRDQAAFQDLLGDGSRYGVAFSYAIQPSPDGLAQAFIIGKSFIGTDSCCLVLGDNVFYGEGLERRLRMVADNAAGATIFTYYVTDPERYGVVEFNAAGAPMRVVEKPREFISNHAVTGLYFYDNDVIAIAESIKPSARGELEITDIIQRYLDAGKLSCERLGRGYAWLDAGTPDSLLEASQFIQTIERRQGLHIACLEEIAFRKGFISRADLVKLAEPISKSDYGRYLLRVAEEGAL